MPDDNSDSNFAYHPPGQASAYGPGMAKLLDDLRGANASVDASAIASGMTDAQDNLARDRINQNDNDRLGKMGLGGKPRTMPNARGGTGT